MMTKKIMTVDDSASMRQMISFTLSSEGYEVMDAVDGEDAIRKLDGKEVDLTITDLNMPNLDGIGLIKRLKEKPEHKFMPILMLTTESQESRKKEGKAAGAAGWIVKPFKPEQLVAVVKKILG
ncbi:MAG: response regulator [Desulfobacteraceae bacterium]|jgi:two-component system chemotaxis response regulator CheY